MLKPRILDILQLQQGHVVCHGFCSALHDRRAGISRAVQRLPFQSAKGKAELSRIQQSQVRSKFESFFIAVKKHSNVLLALQLPQFS